MTEEKLLPCPFCSAKAEIKYDGKDWAFIQCTGCSIHTDFHSTEENAIKEWNTRPQIGDVQILIDVLREAEEELIASADGFSSHPALTVAENIEKAIKAFEASKGKVVEDKGILKAKNIYTILEEINFEKECEEKSEGLIRISTTHSAHFPTQFRQNCFSLIQKFYERALGYIPKDSDKDELAALRQRVKELEEENKTIQEDRDLILDAKMQCESRIHILCKALDIIDTGKSCGQGITREIAGHDINVRTLAKIALGREVKNHYGLEEARKALEWKSGEDKEGVLNCTCGSDTVGTIHYVSGNNSHAYSVRCKKCGKESDSVGSKERAIELWNKTKSEGKAGEDKGFAETKERCSHSGVNPSIGKVAESEVSGEDKSANSPNYKKATSYEVCNDCRGSKCVFTESGISSNCNCKESALRQRVEELKEDNDIYRKGLLKIASRKHTGEMDDDEMDSADFEEGWDYCIKKARKILNSSSKPIQKEAIEGKGGAE